MSVKITVYDGHETIGGNKIFLEFDNHGVFLDFGINYKKLGQFYEEFLTPRVGRGLHDYLMTGQLPKCNIYRNDLVPSDLDISKFPRLSVDAVFITHAHLDHAGMVSMLDFSIPLVSNALTLVLLKCFRDCDSHRIEHDAIYSAVRTNCSDDRRVLVSKRNEEFRTRDLIVTTPVSERFENFFKSCPWGKNIRPPNFIESEEVDIEFKQFDVDHSIYGASAFAINTSLGWIVYTGDLRLHGRHAYKTKKFISEARKLQPLALIIEGTRIDESKDDLTEESLTEESVKEKCADTVAEEKGLVVADFSPRNFERLETFKRITDEFDRELVILMKDAYYLDALACVDGIDHLDGLRIFRDLKARHERFEKKILERHKEALVDPNEIKQDPAHFIVCFSYWDMNRLFDINPSGGTYIYSSSEAYTEEQAIDFIRLKNWLAMFNMKVKGFQVVDSGQGQWPKIEPEQGYHVSGHASREDILKVVESINPDIVIPVHTEKPTDFLKYGYSNVLIPGQNNEIILDNVV